jgi:hypothetical protein
LPAHPVRQELHNMSERAKFLTDEAARLRTLAGLSDADIAAQLLTLVNEIETLARELQGAVDRGSTRTLEWRHRNFCELRSLASWETREGLSLSLAPLGGRKATVFAAFPANTHVFSLDRGRKTSNRVSIQ